MKTNSPILIVLFLAPILFLSSCEDEAPSPPPPPQNASNTAPDTEPAEPAIGISDYEAKRLQEENDDLRQQIADQEIASADQALTEAELSQMEEENEELRSQLETLQNELVRKTAANASNAASDPNAGDTIHYAAQDSQTAELRAQVANLQNRMRILQETQSRALRPTVPVAQAQPVAPLSIQSARYGSQPPTISNVSYFYEPMSRYGNWIQSNQYGYVWSPYQGQDPNWSPYRNGRWGQTDHGWTWFSNEPHGWATTHYGRWARNPGLGWLWVPGTMWAPAWVSLRANDQYAGWAPLPPHSVHQHSFGNNVDSLYGIPYDNYVFVPQNILKQGNYRNHYYPRNQTRSLFPRTSNCTRIDRRTGRHFAHHHGFDVYGGTRAKVPRYNLAFDAPKDHHHHHKLGIHRPHNNTSDIILRMFQPDRQYRSVPASFTRVNSALFFPPIAKAVASAPRTSHPGAHKAAPNKKPTANKTANNSNSKNNNNRPSNPKNNANKKPSGNNNNSNKNKGAKKKGNSSQKGKSGDNNKPNKSGNKSGNSKNKGKGKGINAAKGKGKGNDKAKGKGKASNNNKNKKPDEKFIVDPRTGKKIPISSLPPALRP